MQYGSTSIAPNMIIISSKKNIPIIKMMIEIITVKIIVCITAFSASLKCDAPMYLEINEFPPAPMPLPIPMITKYNGDMNPKAASASVLIPETQKLSIRLFKNIKSIDRIVGIANLFIAFFGSPVIDSIFSLVCIIVLFEKCVFNICRIMLLLLQYLEHKILLDGCLI